MSQSQNIGLIHLRTCSGVKGRGVSETCLGGGFSSDNKALYEMDMSRGRNKCLRRVYDLSG